MEIPPVTANLELADGSSIHFGPDEADAGQIPTSTRSDTVVPGFGYSASGLTVKNPGNVTALDAHLFRKLHQYVGGEKIAEGRVIGFPRVGADGTISIDCEGPLAAIDDDETARMAYRDIDLSAWGPMSNSRRAFLIAAGASPGDPTVYTSTLDGLPSLMLEQVGSWTTGAIPQLEANYEHQLAIARIAGTLRWAFASSAPFDGFVGVADDSDHTNREQNASDLVGSGAGGTTTFDFAATVARKVGLFRFYYTGGAESGLENKHYAAAIRNLALYGNHGLPRRGTEPDAGFYASDVVADAISRWAPGLKVAPNGIETSSYIIPHLAFRDDTTARRIIEAVSLFGASGFLPPDYGYYDEGFFWKTPGTYGREWRVRRSDGITPQDDGPNGEERINGLKISYQDGAGSTYSVGPPGSGATYETTELLDTSPSNPVNSGGIAKRWRSETIGITSQAGAINIGKLLLYEANTVSRTGSTEIKGIVHDSAGNEYPPHLMRAGDTLVVEDDEEDTTAHKISSTSRTDSTVKVEVGAKPKRSTALLAQLQGAIQPAGLGF